MTEAKQIRAAVLDIVPTVTLCETAWNLGWRDDEELLTRFEGYANGLPDSLPSRRFLSEIFPDARPEDELILPAAAPRTSNEIWYRWISFLTASFGETTFDQVEPRFRDLVRWQFFVVALRVSGSVGNNFPSLICLLDSPLRVSPAVRFAHFEFDPRTMLNKATPLVQVPRIGIDFAFVYDGQLRLVRELPQTALALLTHCNGTTGKEILSRVRSEAGANDTDLLSYSTSLLSLARDGITKWA